MTVDLGAFTGGVWEDEFRTRKRLWTRTNCSAGEDFCTVVGGPGALSTEQAPGTGERQRTGAGEIVWR